MSTTYMHTTMSVLWKALGSKPSDSSSPAHRALDEHRHSGSSLSCEARLVVELHLRGVEGLRPEITSQTDRADDVLTAIGKDITTSDGNATLRAVLSTVYRFDCGRLGRQ